MSLRHRAARSGLAPLRRLAIQRNRAAALRQAAVMPAGLDLGVAPANTRLDRMLLLLEPSPARQQALDAFLQAQQTRGNCAYHEWLTPAAVCRSVRQLRLRRIRYRRVARAAGLFRCAAARRPRLDRVLRNSSAGGTGFWCGGSRLLHHLGDALRTGQRHQRPRGLCSSHPWTRIARRRLVGCGADYAASRNHRAIRARRRVFAQPGGSPHAATPRASASSRHAACIRDHRSRREHRHRVAQQIADRRYRRFPLHLRPARQPRLPVHQRARSRPHRRPGRSGTGRIVGRRSRSRRQDHRRFLGFHLRHRRHRPVSRRHRRTRTWPTPW